ncbi:MAG: ribosome maturation factor RimP [Nitrospirota bacterium]
MSKINVQIEELIQPILDSLNIELVLIDYFSTKGNGRLRILIDKEEGITLDNCVMVSKMLSRALDHTEIISQKYHLEVSSPGFDRPLVKEKDFIRFKGKQCKITTSTLYQDRKNFKGELLGFENDEVIICIDNEIFKIPYPKIAKANLVEF